MTMSLSGSMLLAGTASGLIHTYDIASHQLLRTLSSHKGMAITHVSTMLRPPDLIGHISLTLSSGATADGRESIPVRPVAPFQRIRDVKAREAHEVSLMLPHNSVCSTARSLVCTALTALPDIDRRVLLLFTGGAHQRPRILRAAICGGAGSDGSLVAIARLGAGGRAYSSARTAGQGERHQRRDVGNRRAAHDRRGARKGK